MSEAPTGAETPYAGSNDIFRFGPFAFDTSKNRLCRDGVEVHLTPKAARVLGYLLKRPGELIPKGEFLKAIWDGVHVREESLTQAISVIRRATGDMPQDPQFIQTVVGEGYRFIGAVSVVESQFDRRHGFLSRFGLGASWTLWSILPASIVGIMRSLLAK